MKINILDISNDLNTYFYEFHNISVVQDIYISNIIDKYLTKYEQHFIEKFFSNLNPYDPSSIKHPIDCLRNISHNNIYRPEEIIIDKYFKAIPNIQKDILINIFTVFLEIINFYYNKNNENKNISLYIVNNGKCGISFNKEFNVLCYNWFEYIYIGTINAFSRSINLDIINSSKFNNLFYRCCILDIMRSPILLLAINEKEFYLIVSDYIIGNNDDHFNYKKILNQPYSFSNLNEFLVEFSYFNNCELVKYISKNL